MPRDNTGVEAGEEGVPLCKSNTGDLVTTSFPSILTVSVAVSQLSCCTVVLKYGTMGELDGGCTGSPCSNCSEASVPSTLD